jgi:hypothetical protein
MRIYAEQLAKAVAAHRIDYAYDVSQVPMVCERMRAAIERGSFNKEGFAFKGTCKTLGIKHTYTAINAYLAGK